MARGFNGHPRIACPISSSVDEWTVIIDASNSLRTAAAILQYNYKLRFAGTGLFPIVLNAGLTGVYNWSPVVAYDKYDQVWSGWNFDNSGGTFSGIKPPSAAAIYPIVVSCDNFGLPISDFLEVPNTISNGAYINSLSLASRFADELFLTYYDNGNNLLFEKYLPSASVSNLKINQNSLSQTNKGTIENELIKYNSTSWLNLKIYSADGQVIANTRGDVMSMQNALKTFSINAPTAVYIVRIISDDGKFNLSQKFLNNY